MAVTLATTLRVGLNATQANAVDLGTTQFPLRHNYTKSLPTGTTTGKADRLFTDNRHLNASANEDLDLAGVLLDAFGATLTFAKVKILIVEASASNVNDVLVAPGSATAFLGPFGDASDIVHVPPGGIVVFAAPAAGWAVGAGSTDKLNIANGGGTTGVDYTIQVVGTSA